MNLTESRPREPIEHDEEENYCAVRPMEKTKPMMAKTCGDITWIVIFVVVGIVAVIALVIGILALTKVPNMEDQVAPCSPIPWPQNGFENCFGTTCYFSCRDGYGLRGTDHINCNDGKWDANPSTCEPICPILKSPANGNLTVCSDGFFDKSTCSFECVGNHVLEGNAFLTCQGEHEWSSAQPKCVCDKCTTGDNCQYSTSWQNIRDLLQIYRGRGSITVNFGGNNISCHSNLEQSQGYCSIVNHPENFVDCRDQEDLNPATAVTHAAATLIRKMVNHESNPFPEPCDFDRLPEPCRVV